MLTPSPTLSRRRFAGAFLGATALALARHSTPLGAVEPRHPSRRLRILVLGGTHLVGPAVVREALSRDHDVTLFNRGLTRPELFPGVEKLRGNRFPEIGEGLTALRTHREWDVVFDITAYYPRLVEETARLLSGRVGHYIVMSSISVYSDFKEVGLHEESAVRELNQPFEEASTLAENDWGTYGARKVACERTAGHHFGGTVSAVRASGIIGGEFDDTTLYWPARVARGGLMLAPGDGGDAYQSIDVRDVASLLLQLAEQGRAGVFNATGPAAPATFRDYLDACCAVTGSTPDVRWLPWPEMQRLRVTGDETPQWAPSNIVPGFARIRSDKARSTGWTTRPIVESVRSSYLYFREKYRRDYEFPGVGFSPARERELLAQLRA